MVQQLHSSSLHLTSTPFPPTRLISQQVSRIFPDQHTESNKSFNLLQQLQQIGFKLEVAFCALLGYIPICTKEIPEENEPSLGRTVLMLDCLELLVKLNMWVGTRMNINSGFTCSPENTICHTINYPFPSLVTQKLSASLFQ